MAFRSRRYTSNACAIITTVLTRVCWNESFIETIFVAIHQNLVNLVNLINALVTLLTNNNKLMSNNTYTYVLIKIISLRLVSIEWRARYTAARNPFEKDKQRVPLCLC